jgi:hypothetical protein
VDGDGPPFWLPVAPSADLLVRLVNSGSQPWPAGMHLLGAWQQTDEPYLRLAPEALSPLLADPIPALAPGEAVDMRVPLSTGGSARGVVWMTVAGDEGPLTELGSPPLQVAFGD